MATAKEGKSKREKGKSKKEEWKRRHKRNLRQTSLRRGIKTDFANKKTAAARRRTATVKLYCFSVFL
jgi:hypothetical protein